MTTGRINQVTIHSAIEPVTDTTKCRIGSTCFLLKRKRQPELYIRESDRIYLPELCIALTKRPKRKRRYFCYQATKANYRSAATSQALDYWKNLFRSPQVTSTSLLASLLLAT